MESVLNIIGVGFVVTAMSSMFSVVKVAPWYWNNILDILSKVMDIKSENWMDMLDPSI